MRRRIKKIKLAGMVHMVRNNQMESITACLSCGAGDLRHFAEMGAKMHGGAEVFSIVRCDVCGLIQLNPRVKPEYLDMYYSGHYLPFRGPSAWGRYAPMVAMNLAKTDRRRAAIARKAAAIGPGSRVLDVGCGKPSFLMLLHEKTGCRAKGIDWSRSMEDKFIGFMAGMLVTAPLFMLKRWIPAGLMTVIARPVGSG